MLNQLEIHGVKVKQLNINECVRTLVVIMGPFLKYQSQFEKMRKNIDDSMQKVNDNRN